MVNILDDHIEAWRTSPFASHPSSHAWDVVADLTSIVARLVETLDSSFEIVGDRAIHRTAKVDDTAVMKGPLVVGPNCIIAAGSLIRGGCWLDDGCVVGPGTELKTSIVFRGSRLAHFNFVGDSIVGSDVNFEAGSIVANYRNELPDPRLRICYNGQTIVSDRLKFGALVGDGCRIGANAVVAPGAILAPATVVARLGLIDQRPPS